MSDNALIDVEVAHVEKRCGDTTCIWLKAIDGALLPAFEAGAHVDVHIATGLHRQYSICSSPEDQHHYMLGVLKAPESRGGSVAVSEQVRSGDALKISHPRNFFPLDLSAPFSVLVGGGIGITPIVAMAHKLHREHAEFAVNYCVRDVDHAPFYNDLTRSEFSDRVTLHPDRQPGRTSLRPVRDFPPSETGAHIYVCGPTGFMDWVCDEARRLGYPDSRLHREEFAAKADKTGDGFVVEARASGLEVVVKSGQSISEALLEAGVHVDLSCEEGVCGACQSAVIEGVPDHRDVFLTDEEKDSNQWIMPCCSRSKTQRITLDV